MQDIPTLVMLYPSEEEEVYDVINGIETSFSFYAVATLLRRPGSDL